MTLLKIVDYVFLPSFTMDDLGVLEGLIEEYLWNFNKIYPGWFIIPKMHYLVHYPAHIHKYVFEFMNVLSELSKLIWIGIELAIKEAF